jgi:putative membrane protein
MPMLDLIKPKNHPHIHWQDAVKTLILLAMSIYFAALIFTGNLGNYINLRFAWLAYVGAGGFLLLGLWSVRGLLQPHSHADHHEHHDHQHLPLSWAALGVVSIPLLIAIFIPSQPLGLEAVSGGISLQPISGVSAAASFNVPPENRNVLDWLRAFNQAQNPAELDGLPVKVSGFVYREPGMAANQFMVARFTLSCCVADALAIGLPVQVDNAAEFADGAWVEITGSLEAGQFTGELLPIIRPTTVEPIEAPANPYLYS